MEILKASDLRVGNLVTDNWGVSIYEVDSINNKGINLFVEDDGNWSELAKTWVGAEYTFVDIKPIPLTEEWLFKFGFHVDFRDELCVSFIHNKLDCDAIVLDVPKKDFYFNTWEQSKAPQSVHQLQNLYYALIGDELEIV